MIINQTESLEEIRKKLREKTTILWDMDGVLINSEPQHYRTWKRTLKTLFGLEEIDWELYKPCIGATHQKLHDILEENYHVDIFTPGVSEQYQKDADAIEEEEGFPEIDGVREIVDALYREGYKMAVASSSHLDYVEHCIRSIGLYPYMKTLYSGENAAHSKPAPDTFLNTAELLHEAPEACVVVEDSHNGVLAAKNAGMYCIGIKNPDSGDQDISRADVIVETFRDLKELFPTGNKREYK